MFISLWHPTEGFMSAHVVAFVLCSFCMCGSRPPTPSMGLHHLATSIYQHAGRWKQIFINTYGRYRRLLWILSPVFVQGQKPGLTDVQAELDRMTRKQDSVVSTNNVPPLTENEAWRHRCVAHRITILEKSIHLWALKWPNSQRLCQSAHTGVSPKWISDDIRCFDALVSIWMGKERMDDLKDKRWWLGFISVLSSNVTVILRGVSVYEYVCTLPCWPDVLGSRPHLFGVEHRFHGFKDWKYFWLFGFWVILCQERNLVEIGKVFKH